MTRNVVLFWAAVLASVGFYGMFGLWHELGGTKETNFLGVVLSTIGWGGAVLIILIGLWTTYGKKLKEYARDQIRSVQGAAEKAQTSSKSKKAYDELLKYKTLLETDVITKDEFDRKADELKKYLI